MKRIFWVVFLICIFLLNLKVNKLLSFDNGGKWNFDRERINITSPAYKLIVDKYRQDDLATTYVIRNKLYGGWMLAFLWIDSVLKILSPLFWLQILGYSGFILFVFGWIDIINNFASKYWYFLSWLLVVMISSGLGIQIDQKMSIALAAPVVVWVLFLGFKQLYGKKMIFWWLVLLIIDFILK